MADYNYKAELITMVKTKMSPDEIVRYKYLQHYQVLSAFANLSSHEVTDEWNSKFAYSVHYMKFVLETGQLLCYLKRAETKALVKTIEERQDDAQALIKRRQPTDEKQHTRRADDEQNGQSERTELTSVHLLKSKQT